MTVWVLSKEDELAYENKRLLESFAAKKITAKLVQASDFDIIVTRDSANTILYQGKHVELPEVLLVRIGAGISKFMLALIRQIENSGVVTVNTADAIELVKDKLESSQVLSRNRIAIPKTMVVRFPVNAGIITEEIGFPCVVKQITGSYGEGVHLCQRQSDFVSLMGFVETLGTSKTMIVQEYMGERPGEDLRVLVVGGRVIGAMRRTAPPGDFRANITAGGTGELFEVTDEIGFIVRETVRALNLTIAGVDLLFDQDGFRVCEANSNPGFLGFETYCNTDIADQITEYVKFLLR